MNAGDVMYVCHYYNLEVTKTTVQTGMLMQET